MLFFSGLALIAFSVWCSRRKPVTPKPVPITAFEANRSLLSLLASTNALGTNAPAIMDVEAHYSQMWVQGINRGPERWN